MIGEQNYPVELGLATIIEKIHKYENKTVCAALAMLIEVLSEVNEDGSLPKHSRGYIDGKITTILEACQ